MQYKHTSLEYTAMQEFKYEQHVILNKHIERLQPPVIFFSECNVAVTQG